MPEVPEGSIVITPKEFYDGVSNDIKEIKDAVAPLKDMKEEVEKLKVRVTAVEKRLWIAAGFAGAVGTGAGTVIAQALGIGG